MAKEDEVGGQGEELVYGFEEQWRNGACKEDRVELMKFSVGLDDAYGLA